MSTIPFPKIASMESTTLANGVELHVVRGGRQPITRIDIVSAGGPFHSEIAGVAKATSVLIGDGTRNHTQEELAELLDFHAATVSQSCGDVYASVNVFSLDKHMERIIPLIEEMIKEPTFPQLPLDIYLDAELQNYLVRKRQSSHVAMREFSERLFSEGSIYSRHMTEEGFSAITADALRAFHKKTYTPSGMHIFVAGQPSEATLRRITDAFGDVWTEPYAIPMAPKAEYKARYARADVEMADAEQASIVVGRPMPTSDSADVLPLMVLNTILGGYFGSRLMSNIREEKGWTYGISSVLRCRRNYGTMHIEADVKLEKVDATIDEIFKEMRRLREEPVGEEELQTVRNYIRGSLLQSYNTIIRTMENLKHYTLEGLPLDRDRQVAELLGRINSEDIQELAVKYLREEEMRVLATRRAATE